MLAAYYYFALSCQNILFSLIIVFSLLVNDYCNFLKSFLISLFSLLFVCIKVLLLRIFSLNFAFVSGGCLRLIPELELVVWELMELASLLEMFSGNIGGGSLSLEALMDRGTFPEFSYLHLHCTIFGDIYCLRRHPSFLLLLEPFSVQSAIGFPRQFFCFFKKIIFLPRTYHLICLLFNFDQ